MPHYNSLAYTPRLRVSRAVAACSRCRQAKIKCNGNLPACDACEKAGRGDECSSSNDQFAKGKERSFVASLEARIDKLNKRLEFARARKESVVLNDMKDAVGVIDRKDSLALIRAAIRGNEARRREKSDMDQLVSDFGFLFTNASTRDFESTTTTMTFARLILAASAMAPMPEANSTASLPPKSVVLNTVQQYIDNVLVFYPAYDPVSILGAMENLYFENGQNATAVEHWLLYMVLAIADLCRSRSNDDDFYVAGVHWASRALLYADQLLAPGHLSQIQALILLVQYAMLDPAHFDCWPLLGFATRSIVDLGLHQDAPYGQGTERQVDVRRKIFYCVYALDRSISMVHIRSFSFADDAINVAFPAIASTALTTSIGTIDSAASHTAIVLFQIRRLQSKWYQELFMSSREPLEDTSPYIWAMLQELREWFDDLPEQLPRHIQNLFVLEFLYSNVYCLAPSCRNTVTSELGKTLIFEYGTDFIAKMFENIKNPSLSSTFFSYYDVLKVLFVARQVIAILDESEDNRDLLFNPNRHHITPSVEGETQIPLVPNQGRFVNIDRAIAFIGQTAEIFDAWGKRWEDSKNIQMTFRALVSSLLPLLCQRKADMGIENGRRFGEGFSDMDLRHERSLPPTYSTTRFQEQNPLHREHSY